MVPALAIADALSAEGAIVSFIGTRERAEAELVPAAGFEIDFIDVRGLDRRNPVRAARAVWLAARAVGHVKDILRRRRAEVLLGGGGYVAGVAGSAATRLGIPLVLTEADSHLGFANRRLAGYASRVCLAFPVDGREGDTYLVTGRPVPEEVLSASRPAARERFGLAEGEHALLVFGGSLGARSVNEAAFAAFAERPDGPRVIHISGTRDHQSLRERLDAVGSPAHYTLLPYEPNLGSALAASDLVLARAGGSIFELTAAGRPAILVPYPHATSDHQSANARWMAESGAAITIPDQQLTPQGLAKAVEELFADPRRLSAMAAASHGLARPDAAERIAAEVLAA